MTSEEEDTASLVLLAHFENKLRLRPQERLAAIQTALERGADPHRCVGHVSHTSVSFVEWSFIRTDLGVLGVLVRHGIDPDAIFPENKIHWMTFLFYMFLRHLVGKDSTPFIYHKHAARDVTCILQFLLRHCGDRFELALAYRAAEMHRYLRCGRPGSGSVRTSIQLTQVMGVLVDARENQGFVLPLDVIRRVKRFLDPMY